MIVAERDGVVLRHATDGDLPGVDEITIICYRPIFESYVAMLGEECYRSFVIRRLHRLPQIF
jgi:hypothetical protein